MVNEKFRAGRSSVKVIVRRFVHRIMDAQPSPPSHVLNAADPAPRWTLYFCYAPDGQPTHLHRATLAALRAGGHRTLIVLATKDVANIASFFTCASDALIWKGLEGYDFSAYTIGLRHLAETVSGCDVIVMNDSITGPLSDLNAIFDPCPWDFVGLTSCDKWEPHIQSYAFMIRGLTTKRFAKLHRVFSPRFCYSNFKAVVRNQESIMARVASRSMTVGVVWPTQDDATVNGPIELIEAGFPFIKNSHFGKFQDSASANHKSELIRLRDAFLMRHASIHPL